MISVVRPELSTASVGSSQAPTAAVDNSAPRSTHPEPTYKSWKTVQPTGTTSVHALHQYAHLLLLCRPTKPSDCRASVWQQLPTTPRKLT